MYTKYIINCVCSSHLIVVIDSEIEDSAHFSGTQLTVWFNSIDLLQCPSNKLSCICAQWLIFNWNSSTLMINLSFLLCKLIKSKAIISWMSLDSQWFCTCSTWAPFISIIRPKILHILHVKIRKSMSFPEEAFKNAGIHIQSLGLERMRMIKIVDKNHVSFFVHPWCVYRFPIR